jgi:LytS/YehU family sensor histidine kinase
MTAVLALLKVRIDSAYMKQYFSRIVTEEHSRLFLEVIVNSFFALQSLLYCIVREWIVNKRTEGRLREEKLNFELKYLKSQINPHFLFNTLNNLYSIALKNKDDETAKGITKLSQMMRFMLEGVNEDLVLLEKEITYLTSYLDLQKLRFSEQDDVRINFDIKGDITGIRIPAFIFIVFIENAFKYGIDYKKHSFVDIKFEVSDNTLRFNIRNSIHKTGDLQNPGIGLKNIRGRLDLLFPGRYNLEITSENDIFNLDLSIRFPLS